MPNPIITGTLRNKFIRFTLGGFAAANILSACSQADLVTSPEQGSRQVEAELAARKKKATQPAPAPVDTTSTSTGTTGGTSTGGTTGGTSTGTTAPTTPVYQNTISWSGMNWTVRNSSSYTGPGLNVFSNSSNNVWVDASGNLHLKITYTNGRWVSAEILSEKYFGYGEYIFYLSSQADKLDKNVVLGMFTWNNNSFQTDANSEVDIEFSKWGMDNYTRSLQYSVQPTNWSHYADRESTPSGFNLTGDYSTHGFKWTPQSVSFKSYYDHGYPTSWIAASWDFIPTSPRSKVEGGKTSDPVYIPKPGTTTRVHLNLWLHDTNRDGFGDAPSNGQTAEVVIKKFEFKPLIAA